MDMESGNELAESLFDLFSAISIMVNAELQGSSEEIVLLEKMNNKVEEEYEKFGDIASGIRVYVEQLKVKNAGFDDYIEQIERIDQKVTEFEAIVSLLDKRISVIEFNISHSSNPQSRNSAEIRSKYQ